MLIWVWLILPCICGLWATPTHEVRSYTHRSHGIVKREYLIDCGHYSARFGEPHTQGFSLGSLKDLCLGYPQGLGAFCDGPDVEFREPRNPLFFQPQHEGGGGGGISYLCGRLCHCHDLAPDLPAIHDEPADHGGSTCSDDEGNASYPSEESQPSQATGAVQCLNNEDTDSQKTYSSHFTCDAGFYGHPKSADCKGAIRQLPDWGEAHNVIRQYFETGDLSAKANPYYFAQEVMINDETSLFFRNKVEAPIILTKGQCKVAVMLPQNPPRHTEPALVGSEAVITAAEGLRTGCVDARGVGGKFDRFWLYEGALLIPHIFMFEKDSLMDDWLTLKTTELLSSPESSQQTACSGSCMNPDDCDISSNCVCASDKPIPLSSTWGQHACMYAAGAALAYMQATALKPFSRCRGRCLSYDNELDNRTGPANVTNHTAASTASYAHRTVSLPLSVSRVRGPATDSAANHDIAGSDTLTSDKAFTSIHPVISESSTRTSINGLPKPLGLTCPCNCTYVSAACCLSPIVWEDPKLQIHMDPLPMNSTVRCNATSGAWMPKTSPLSSFGAMKEHP